MNKKSEIPFSLKAALCVGDDTMRASAAFTEAGTVRITLDVPKQYVKPLLDYINKVVNDKVKK